MKLNDKMNTRYLARDSFFINQVKETLSNISLEAFVLLVFVFFFYLSVNLSFLCFFFLVMIRKGEQVFLTVNPTFLMGWLGSLRFFDTFVDCLVAIGHFSPSLIYGL